MGSPVLNGRTTFLFLVFLRKEMWARHLRKSCKPDATSYLGPSLGVFLFFGKTEVSGSFQWLRVDKELFWFLAIGWIPGLFISFCTETCEAIECLGESYHFS